MSRTGGDHISFEPGLEYNLGGGTHSPSGFEPRRQPKSSIPPPIPPKKSPLSSYGSRGTFEQRQPYQPYQPYQQQHASPPPPPPPPAEEEFPWAELEDLRRLHDIFDDTIGDLAATKTDLETTRQELAQKEADFVLLTEANKRLTTVLQQRQREHRDDTLQMGEGNHIGAAAAAEVRELRQRISSLTNDLEDSRHDVARAERRLKNKQQDWDEERDRLEAKVAGGGAASERQLADLTRQAREAEERVAVLQEENRSLVERSRTETSSSDALRDFERKMERLREAIEFYKKNSEKVARNNAELKDENRRLAAVAERTESGYGALGRSTHNNNHVPRLYNP